LWRYPGETGNSVENTNLALQGIRITLSPAGLPAIWEVLRDRTEAELIFVSRSLESAAQKEFGKALPGRRFAVERNLEQAPGVIVARIIEDGPVAMGPMVYLSAGSRSVSTVICRCMPAQAKRLRESRTYELAPITPQTLDSFKARFKARTAFWPEERPDPERANRCLRMPHNW